MELESKQRLTPWWKQLLRKRNMVLSGLGVAALSAVLAASSNGFGQPEAKKAAPPAKSAGAGLKGIIPQELPDGLLAGAFDPLGEKFQKWSEQVGENLFKLYGGETGDATEQRQALVALQGQLVTLKAAINQPENSKIRDVMVDLYGRLHRRVEIFTAVLDTLEADPESARNARLKAEGARVIAALDNLRDVLRTYQNGLAWLSYVKSRELVAAVNAGEFTAPVFAEVKQKLAARGKLSATQASFLGQPAFSKLEAALGDVVAAANSPAKKVNVAGLRAQLKTLVAAIEKYEATNGATAAAAVRKAFEQVRGTSADGGAALADAMRSHYVNYNYRIYISEPFMNRLIDERRVDRSPVSDYILGASVSGNQSTVARISIDFKESPKIAWMDLVLTGTTQSNTVGVTEEATVWTSGYHTFHARQGATFNGDRFAVYGRTRIGVNANNRTTGFTTKYSRVPILGAFANSIASREIAKKRGQSEAIAAQKIRERVVPEFKKEVDDALAQANKDINDRVISKLKESDLMPETRSVRTTDHYLLLSGRVMSPDELSGSMTNPSEIPGTGLTVRFHESLMNSAVDKISLAGRKMTSEEIKEEIRNSISDFLGDNYDPELEKSGAQPMGKKKPSTDKFVFHPTDPIRLQVRNGKLNVVIRCGLEREGEEPIPMQIITVPLTFGLTKDDITITRGTVSVAPAAAPKDRAKQIVRAGVMRKKIESAIPNETRKRTLTFERKGKKPIHVAITKIKTVNGWFTVWVN